MAVDPQQQLSPLQELAQRGRAWANEVEQAARERLRAHRSRWDHSTPGRSFGWMADVFFAWLFRDWGFEPSEDGTDDGSHYWHPPRPPSADAIRDGVDEALAKKAAAANQVPAPPEPEAAEADTREQSEPQDLDAVIDGVDGPPPTDDPGQRFAPGLTEYYDVNPDWCNCTGMAHEAHCRAAAIGDFDVDDLLPPDPSGTASEPEPEPAVPNL